MTAGLRVLIAPDCFGDSLTAVEAAEAIAAGWHRGRPRDDLVLAPLSDGGPGFIDVLTARHPDWRSLRSSVRGPLSDQVEATWVFDPATATAYIECAQACGLALLDGEPTVRTALAAQSAGVGELIDQALRCGADAIVIGLGGSACTDGGRGMVEVLGGFGVARRKLSGVDLIAATDVENPLLGPSGAAPVFGPQKGADPRTVEVLQARLKEWAEVLEAATGGSIAGLPGAGAAGGLGAALLALGGRRESGARVIADHTGLDQEIARADLLISGEGRLDEQSLHGKVVGSLAAAARERGLPVLVLAGQVALSALTRAGAGITEAHALSDHAGSVQRAIDDAAGQLSGLANLIAENWPNGSREKE